MGKKVIVVIMGVCLVLTSVSCSMLSKGIRVVNTWKCIPGQQIYHAYPIGGTDDLFVSYFEDNKKGDQDRRTARIDKNGKQVWKLSSDWAPEFDGNGFVFNDPVTRKTSYFDPISGKARKTVDGRYLQSDIFGKLNIFETVTNPKKLVRLDETGKKIWDKDINDDNSLEESFLIGNKLILINQGPSMIICPWRPINETNTNNVTPKDQEYDMNSSYIECDLTITVLDYSTGKQLMQTTYPVKDSDRYDSDRYEINSKWLLPYYLRADNKDKPIIVINNMSKAIDCLTGKTIWETKEKRHFAKWIEGKPNICVFTSLNGQKIGLFNLLTGNTVKISKTLDGQIANVDIFNNTIVCELECPPNNKNLDKMKMIGFDIETGDVKWERNLQRYAQTMYDKTTSFTIDDGKGNGINCIAVEEIGLKSNKVLFINVISGETIAVFDNVSNLNIKTIKSFGDSLSLVCDNGMVVGVIDYKLKKLTITYQLVSKSLDLQNGTILIDNNYDYVFNNLAVYTDNKDIYIYDIKTLDKVFQAEDLSISNYDYDGKSIFGWAGDKAIKIDFK